MELKEWGVPFKKYKNSLDQRISDYATYPRVCWVKNGATGYEIFRSLLNKLNELKVPIMEEVMVFRLLEKKMAIYMVQYV